MADPATTPAPHGATGVLVLASGEIVWGRGFGAEGAAVGEVCFNTAMTGYQEIMTDPSYAGQIVTFTFPHIGNVGANAEDIEAINPHALGCLVRQDVTNPSNFRASQHFDQWMKVNGRIGLSGVDTRALTRLIRRASAPNAVIAHSAKGAFDVAVLLAQARGWPGLEGMDLAKSVTTLQTYGWDEGLWSLEGGYARPGVSTSLDMSGNFKTELSQPAHIERSPDTSGSGRDASPPNPLMSSPSSPLISSPPNPLMSSEVETPGKKPKVVAIDYGIKRNILRNLIDAGADVTVVPATASFDDIMAHAPDGLFLSNGPGDPAATGDYAVPVIRQWLETKKPLFGICLGHQMLGLAVGARTSKMHQGHRGANHPVKRVSDGAVEITSMNHGFAVESTTLPANARETHVSLFDGSNCGFELTGQPAFSVQYHPEASPGPQDSHYLFDKFVSSLGKATLRN